MTMSLFRDDMNISESVRERETFRHDPTLLTHTKYNDTGGLIPTLELSDSADPILTALAQLGVCRTGASRAFISLFDKKYQYIIAEATQTSSLIPKPHDDEQSDRELWLRGTAIPRSMGVFQRVLNTSKVNDVKCEEGLPINIICDIRADPDLKDKSCVLLESDARGYVGIPIRSQNGVDFGEYCVITEQPLKEDGWSDDNSAFLREISQSVREHLLSRTSQIDRSRAESMIRGMGAFLEQRPAWVGGKQHPFDNPEKEVSIEKPASEARNRAARGSDDVSPQSRPCLQPDSASPPASSLETHSYPDSPTGPPNGPDSISRRSSPTIAQLQEIPACTKQDPLDIVFSRSAATIQEAIGADGVIFFDANAGVFNALAHHGAESDESDSNESDNSPDPSPHVIALSEHDAQSSETEAYESGPRRMSFRALSSLLRRYSEGTIFDFDDDGNPQPGSLPDSSSRPNNKPAEGRPKPVKQRTLSFIGNLSSEVTKTFPGARSVAFAPVLDHVKKRPQAGCFAYTRSKTRFFGKHELNFMLAMGPLAMAEIASLETDLANRAQSDVLSSLSHELRSPLHGIVSAVDLLAETKPTGFQLHLLHILETCGGTLSDTVDHLLYHARVNNFKSPSVSPNIRPRGLRGEMIGTLQEGMKDLMRPVHLDKLVEEVTESLFAGFNFQRSSIGSLDGDLRRTSPSIPRLRENETQNAEEPNRGQKNDQEAPYHVVIDLDIDPSCSHYYYTSSSDVRRIVMNLFGNALKFTRFGSIRVALTQERVQHKKYGTMAWAKMVVADTGRGISEDFLAHHLFQGFCQEDTLEPGLGLGLSVVKKAVRFLKGRVTIESKVGVGTTATVLLPLRPFTNTQAPLVAPRPESTEYAEQKKKLRGLRVCLVGFNGRLSLPRSSCDAKQGTLDDDYQSIREICLKDLGMQIVPFGHDGLAPDIVLFEQRMLYDPRVKREAFNKIPLVFVCTDTLSAYDLSRDAEFENPSGVVEFISQPTGPRKLAKTLVAILQRWMERQNPTQSANRSPPRTVSPNSESSKKGEPHKRLPQPIVIPDRGVFGAELPEVQYETSRSRVRISPPPLSPRSLSISMAQTQEAEPRVEVNGSGNGSDPHSSLSSSEPFTPRKFLLVEDNQLNMKILCTYMGKLGQDYDTAEDGQVAVDKVRDGDHRHRRKSYECILMDINMPRLDGLEATRQIRQYEATNHLEPATIIAISGLASADVQQDAFQSGINLFLTKPVQFKEISEILKNKSLL